MWHKQAIIEWSWHVILLLLAATVWSFAHMPLGISDSNNSTSAFSGTIPKQYDLPIVHD